MVFKRQRRSKSMWIKSPAGLSEGIMGSKAEEELHQCLRLADTEKHVFRHDNMGAVVEGDIEPPWNVVHLKELPASKGLSLKAAHCISLKSSALGGHSCRHTLDNAAPHPGCNISPRYYPSTGVYWCNRKKSWPFLASSHTLTSASSVCWGWDNTVLISCCHFQLMGWTPKHRFNGSSMCSMGQWHLHGRTWWPVTQAVNSESATYVRRHSDTLWHVVTFMYGFLVVATLLYTHRAADLRVFLT